MVQGALQTRGVTRLERGAQYSPKAYRSSISGSKTSSASFSTSMRQLGWAQYRWQGCGRAGCRTGCQRRYRSRQLETGNRLVERRQRGKPRRCRPKGCPRQARPIIASCYPLSRWVPGSDGHLGSKSVLFLAVTGGQAAGAVAQEREQERRVSCRRFCWRPASWPVPPRRSGCRQLGGRRAFRAASGAWASVSFARRQSVRRRASEASRYPSCWARRDCRGRGRRDPRRPVHGDPRCPAALTATSAIFVGDFLGLLLDGLAFLHQGIRKPYCLLPGPWRGAESTSQICWAES